MIKWNIFLFYLVISNVLSNICVFSKMYRKKVLLNRNGGGGIMKKVFIIGCIVCSLIIGVWWFFSDKAINPNELIATNCNVNNKSISFNINMTTAALVIRNYTLEYKYNTLYIEFKGNLFTSNKNGISNVTIKNKYKNLENIYITNGRVNKKILSRLLI